MGSARTALQRGWTHTLSVQTTKKYAPCRFDTAIVHMVQLLLSNPPNCAGYFNNVQLRATGFNWTWKFDYENPVA